MVFHPADIESTVLFFSLAATLPQTYFAPLLRLLRLAALRFPPHSVIRGSLEEFVQWEINPTQICCTKKAYAGEGIEKAIDHLRESVQSKLVLFTNS